MATATCSYLGRTDAATGEHGALPWRGVKGRVMAAKKVSREVIKGLAKQKLTNTTTYSANLAVISSVIGLDTASIDKMVDNEINKVDVGIRASRAAELTSIVRDILDPIMSRANSHLEEALENKMVPRFILDNGKIVFEIIAKRGPGRPGSSSVRFKPDILTFLDGTIVDGKATDVLRREEYRNTKAGIDQRMVDEKKAKGARSAVFLGLQDDAAFDLPIFRVWVFKRDDGGKVIFRDGRPSVKEIDAKASQYVDDISQNKKKYNNKKLAEIRAANPSPKWTKQILDKFNIKTSVTPTSPKTKPFINLKTNKPVSPEEYRLLQMGIDPDSDESDAQVRRKSSEYGPVAVGPVNEPTSVVEQHKDNEWIKLMKQQGAILPEGSEDGF